MDGRVRNGSAVNSFATTGSALLPKSLESILLFFMLGKGPAVAAVLPGIRLGQPGYLCVELSKVLI